jgi:hypothetical protein
VFKIINSPRKPNPFVKTVTHFLVVKLSMGTAPRVLSIFGLILKEKPTSCKKLTKRVQRNQPFSKNSKRRNGKIS